MVGLVFKALWKFFFSTDQGALKLAPKPLINYLMVTVTYILYAGFILRLLALQYTHKNYAIER